MLRPYHKAELTFDFISEIGQDGQNSRTYITRDHQLNAQIVTKQIRKDRLNSTEEFFAESQALYSSSHPNVVQIHYACYDDEHIYIAMPYYLNGSVKDLITRQYLTVREIITFGSQILAGLHNVHSKGLIHFDIKPDNILLSTRREALISDFGLAKQMNLAGIAPQNRLYTPMIPPEVISTDHFDRRFDIYQVGLTLYRMCNGNNHFYQQLNKYGLAQEFDREKFAFDLQSGRFPDRNSFAPNVPLKLRTVIKKCLHVDPVDRYQSALEVANAMADIKGNHLDWRLTSGGDQKVWTKSIDRYLYKLNVNEHGTTTLYKSVDGGDFRKVKSACIKNATEAKLRKIFGDY